MRWKIDRVTGAEHIEATYVQIEDGSAAFLDERRDLIRAYAPGTWTTIERWREETSTAAVDLFTKATREAG